ncbi:prenyltransferase/squalene oxidase repeat-containing protein [Maioricimonas rarisocia]|uniref:prenyltransferase/squalene oxidase repeat-containing protein n=1 Tax=Maioricimonas rarisocia TaxID=2528026 RepID=UPI0011A81CC3|nr:prenyltransferase/squalene oxidase repeat-containing protein [Maioricimonas rarisocia]
MSSRWDRRTPGVGRVVWKVVCPLLVGSVLIHSSHSFAVAQVSEDDQAVDAAIAKAIAFLASEQQPSGAWRTDSFGESTAATSLAVMSFLAAGYMPGEPPYGEQIERGIRWVLKHQEANGMLVHRRSHGPMYSHGISALMLAEVIGMVDRSDAVAVRSGLERSIRLILESQAVAKDVRHAGGWRYQVDSRDSDLSVTGWQLLALRAAKDVGCDVPAEAIDKAVEYVKRCSVRDDRGFGYQPGSGQTPTLTGTGITCLEVCGVHNSPEAVGGAEWLLDHPLTLRTNYFYYGAYYSGVGMFKIGGKYARASRDNLVDLLLPTQEPDGSWQARQGSERGAGRIYATSMAVLALAVEYRYLPIYQR